MLLRERNRTPGLLTPSWPERPREKLDGAPGREREAQRDLILPRDRVVQAEHPAPRILNADRNVPAVHDGRSPEAEPVGRAGDSPRGRGTRIGPPRIPRTRADADETRQLQRAAVQGPPAVEIH